MITSTQGIDLGKIWERFVCGIDVDLSKLRPEIAESWRRSRAAQVSPKLVTAPQATDPMSPWDEDLTRLGGPVVSFLDKALVGKGKVICLSNRDSRVLTTIGGTLGLETCMRVNGMPGSIWNERETGTTVIGTGIVEGKPIEVKWREHYVEDFQKDWACCSAPIFDPFEREIIGLLLVGMVGMSERGASPHPCPVDLVVHGTRLITELVGKLEAERRLVLNNAYAGFLRRYPDAAMLAVDAHDYVVQMTDRAGSLVGKYAVQVGQRLPELLGLGSTTQLTSATGTGLPHEVTLAVGDRTATATVYPVRQHDRVLGRIVLLVPPKPACSAQPTKQAWRTHFSFPSIIGHSELLKQAVRTAQNAARTDYPILLIGESGTGKELFAHSIHDGSARREGPFVAFNCGTLSLELVVAEMCGYEPGAFTGADRRTRKGMFDLAHGGTLFLDELQDMDPKAQCLLLRFLETGTFVRVGGAHPIQADVRVITATNIAVADLERQQLVRPDLLYRLNCIMIQIPALRERPEDIRVIGEHCLRTDLHFTGAVDEEVWTALQRCQWPGNIRELRNVLLRATLACADNHLTVVELPRDLLRQAEETAEPTGEDASGARGEDLAAVLREAEGNVREAARRLGIHWTTLYRRLARVGLKPTELN